MNKYFRISISFFVLALMVVPLYFALAHDGIDDGYENEQEHAQTSFPAQKLQIEREKKLGEFKMKMEEKRQNFDKKMRGFTEQRFKALAARFTKLANRMQARIDILKANGKDTTKAQELLNQAKVDITNLQTEFGDRSKSITADEKLTSEEMVARIKAGQEAFKNVQAELKQVLFEIKGIDDDYIKNTSNNNGQNNEQ